MKVWPALFLLIGCGDETLSAFSATDTFTLALINSASYEANATINIGESGRISGTAPCNSYSASQSAPYPWFDIGPIAATKRACADLDAEGRYFDMLSKMTIAEVAGTTLILTNDAGDEMVFQAP